MLKEMLKSRGAQVTFFDPKVKGNFNDSEDNLNALLNDKDVIVIPILHDEIDYDIEKWKNYLKKDAVIFDAKGIINKDRATALGFHYYTI
jgi:UDP-N-acetyl-D-mannosaminuronate dehydrogenase